MPNEVLYARGDLSAVRLDEELRRFFAEAGADPHVRLDAESGGVDLTVALAGGVDQIRIAPADAGFSGLEGAIMVVFMQPPIESLWSEVILPWLRRRTEKPVGEEQTPDE
jgi:hypothetical protein